MPTRRIRSKNSLVTVVRDTATRNEATEVYATPIPVQENEITVDQLGYHAVDASALAIAAVSSQKFAVGTYLPAGEGIQRVPAPISDYEYWIDVIDGDIELHKSGIHADEDIINVSADASGITMTPTATDPARIYLTGRLRRPKSGKLYVDVTTTQRASATIATVTTASPSMQFNTTAAHVVEVLDTVVVSGSSRTIALTTGFSGHPSTPIITITVPTGHGIADAERLTLTTTGNIATHLPSGGYTPVVVSATQLQITGVVSGPAIPGAITGTMSIALSTGWLDGTYEADGADAASYVRVPQPVYRYTGGRTIGTNAAFTDSGTITPVGPPPLAVKIVWWATDELATNHRYFYPLYPAANRITNLDTDYLNYTYSATSIVVDTGTGKATLALTTAPDMAVGELVNVSGTTGVPGTTGPLDGQFVITDVGPYTISWATAETTPTTARSLSAGGEAVGRAKLEVYDYAVYVELEANTAPALLSKADVFEVVGSSNSTSGSNTAELSPSGFSLTGSSSTGGASTDVQLTNDTDTVLKVQEYSESDKAYKDTAVLYSNGTISGVLLKGDEINIDGVNVVDTFAAVTRNGAAFSDTVSLLNRLARGVVYHGRWSQPTTLTMAAATGAQEYVVAHGSFVLEDGRAYRVDLSTGGLVFEQPSRLVFAEVRFSTTPFTSGNYGTSYHLSSYAGGSSTTTDWFVVDGLSGVFHASSAVSAVTDNYRLPAAAPGSPPVPIYWSFIVRTAGTISTAITASSRASLSGTAASALVVEDIGPSLLNSSGSLSTSATYVGALTSSGGPGTTTYTATKTITATETAYFDNYGRGSSGTSDPYANQYSLYQGNPGTASGTKKSAIEFPALGLTGTSPTITGMRLWLKNRHTYDGSCVVSLGAHGVAELSTTLPTARTTPARVTRTFSSGEGAWVTLPSSWYAEFLSGASDGVLVGITNTSTNAYDSTLSNYGYFDGVGVGMTSPPRLEITWTYTA